MGCCSDINSRFDFLGFTLPEEYQSEEEILAKENKLLACKLFIDSFKVLTYEEFNAVQAILVIEQLWDKTSKAPTMTDSAYFTTYDEVPLSLLAITKILDSDKIKVSALLNSAFRKLPILKTILPTDIVDMILENQVELKESTSFLKDKEQFQIFLDNFNQIGKRIRKGITTTKGSCMYSSDYHPSGKKNGK